MYVRTRRPRRQGCLLVSFLLVRRLVGWYLLVWALMFVSWVRVLSVCRQSRQRLFVRLRRRPLESLMRRRALVIPLARLLVLFPLLRILRVLLLLVCWRILYVLQSLLRPRAVGSLVSRGHLLPVCLLGSLLLYVRGRRQVVSAVSVFVVRVNRDRYT